MPNPNWMPPGQYGVNDAINSLRPGAMYQLENRDFRKWWHHQNPPSWKEIMDESDRLKTVAYQQCRVQEYPPIQEFIDAYYWNTKGDSSKLEAYFAKVEEVKQKYPKPTQEQIDANVPYSE